MKRRNYKRKKKSSKFDFNLNLPKVNLSDLSLSMVQRNLPFVLFTAALIIVYIFNSHNAEHRQHLLQSLEEQNENLRAEYLTTDAKLSKTTKQSSVAKRVASIGLKESVQPPNVIYFQK